MTAKTPEPVSEERLVEIARWAKNCDQGKYTQNDAVREAIRCFLRALSERDETIRELRADWQGQLSNSDFHWRLYRKYLRRWQWEKRRAKTARCDRDLARHGERQWADIACKATVKNDGLRTELAAATSMLATVRAECVVARNQAARGVELEKHATLEWSDADGIQHVEAARITYSGPERRKADHHEVIPCKDDGSRASIIDDNGRYFMAYCERCSFKPVPPGEWFTSKDAAWKAWKLWAGRRVTDWRR